MILLMSAYQRVLLLGMWNITAVYYPLQLKKITQMQKPKNVPIAEPFSLANDNL